MAYTPWTRSINFPGMPVEESVVATVPTPNYFQIPADSSPNQSFETTLNIDGGNLKVLLTFRYNEMAGYWMMGVANAETGVYYVDSVPLITGLYPAANVLDQYRYLNIGSAYVIPVGSPDIDYPDDTKLGTQFLLIWSDTPA